MSDKKITELLEIPSAGANDPLAIVDLLDNTTKKIKFSSLFTSISWDMLTDTPSSKTGNAKKLIQVSNDELTLEYISTPTVDGIQFDVSASPPPHSPGLSFWDTANKTISSYIDITGVTLQNGFELWKRVKNNTAGIITNGTVVYINGEDSGIPTIGKANASSAAKSQGTLGFATHDIGIGEEGIITRSGGIRGINTVAYPAGTPLFLSIVDGEYTNIPPVSPNYIIRLGISEISHVTDGILDAAIDIGSNVQGVIEIFNGSILEDRTVKIESNGTIVTCTLEKTGGGDLTLFFNGGFVPFDCTPKASVTLTAGSDQDPARNYVYILESTGVLETSLSGFPTDQHVPVADTMVQSATSLQTEGAR
ncbi:MAG: hypothetical protein KAS32_16860, partial [Candidatus Peribacteraceae bacterium]|nr:hypothetical protein [Candidatus Peribacteraceae bacterium]